MEEHFVNVSALGILVTSETTYEQMIDIAKWCGGEVVSISANRVTMGFNEDGIFTETKKEITISGSKIVVNGLPIFPNMYIVKTIDTTYPSDKDSEVFVYNQIFLESNPRVWCRVKNYRIDVIGLMDIEVIPLGKLE